MLASHTKHSRIGSQAHMDKHSIPLIAYSIKVYTKEHPSVPLTQIQIEKKKACP